MSHMSQIFCWISVIFEDFEKQVVKLCFGSKGNFNFQIHFFTYFAVPPFWLVSYFGPQVLLLDVLSIFRVPGIYSFWHPIAFP